MLLQRARLRQLGKSESHLWAPPRLPKVCPRGTRLLHKSSRGSAARSAGSLAVLAAMLLAAGRQGTADGSGGQLWYHAGWPGTDKHGLG